MKRAAVLGVLVVAAFGRLLLAADAVRPAGPYDPSADGWGQVKAAAAGAASDGKRVLVIVGGNWCTWCRALDRLMGEDAALKAEVAAHYELVHLNWSKENKNEAAMAKLGHPDTLGFPAFVVVSSKLKVLHLQESGAFENPDHSKPGHDPSKLLAFLQAWDGSR
ncbi:MAG TPA: thioredoxin family protein [Thermoanaerobaculaceae bacterium]|nr:thioredoxin family protein [Thermoanaerobaculaceae bacterium]